MELQPEIFVIAGPNGAGKTTAAYSLLPSVFNTVEFVNADEIARGLSPLNPEGVAFEAGRIMLGRMQELIGKGKSFAFETTLSGLSYVQLIKGAREKGYLITMFFVYLESPELAMQRVAIRVSKGGHNIPTDVIKRRYYKGVANFVLYCKWMDSWYLMDNSGEEYNWVAKYADDTLVVSDEALFKKIMTYDTRTKN